MPRGGKLQGKKDGGESGGDRHKTETIYLLEKESKKKKRRKNSINPPAKAREWLVIKGIGKGSLPFGGANYLIEKNWKSFGGGKERSESRSLGVHLEKEKGENRSQKVRGEGQVLHPAGGGGGVKKLSTSNGTIDGGTSINN